MRKFPSAFRFDAAYKWLSAHASGPCSILVTLPALGVAAYQYAPQGALYRRLYGPLAVRP